MDVATRNPGMTFVDGFAKDCDFDQVCLKKKKKKERTKTHTCEATGCHRSFDSDSQLQSHKKYLHPELLVGKKKKKKNKKAKEHGIQPPSVFPCYFCPRALCKEEDLRRHKEAKGHGSSEVMVNQQEPRSIFVMLSSHATHYGFLYEIDLDKLEENEGKKDEHTQPLLYPVLELFDKKWEIPKTCLFHGARFGSKVYILCNEIKFPCRSPLRPTDAFCFDTNDLDSNLERFSPPKSAKIWCAVISAYGNLYYLAYPSCYPHIKNDSFERYDPIKDYWESLPPYPHYSEANLEAQISGHAVLYGYILISMLSKKGCQLTAFHIATKTWHQVRLNESMEKIHDGFRGRAVVVDNIIYALSSEIDELLAFSFCWDSNDGVDIALRSHYVGPLVCLLIKDQAPVPCPFDLMTTQRLIHLGGRDLCLVQTGWNQYSHEHQYHIVTRFRVFSGGQEPYIQTLNSRTFRIPVDIHRYYFDLDFGFTRDFSEIEP